MTDERDPFEILRRDPVAIEPRPEFAAGLRRRVAAALGGVDPGSGPEPIPTIDLGTRTPMTSPTSTETTTGTPAAEPVADGDVTPTGLVSFGMPSLVVAGGAAAVEFYRRVFGATVSMEAFVEDDGRIGHVELDLGGTTISVADEYPEYDIYGPRHLGGTPVALTLRVPRPADVDVIVERGTAAGAEIVFPPSDQFYGERSSRIRDPWGHEWIVQGRIEDLTVAQMQERFAAEPAPGASTES